MSNMTAYEMLSGFINYFIYNATDFTKEDIASALLKLSGEFTDTGTVQDLKGYEALYHRSVGEIYKIRALLKEVKDFIEEENPKDFTIMSERMDELLTKIEEVL